MTNRTQLLAEAVVSAYINDIAEPARPRLRLDGRAQPAEDHDQLHGLVLGEVPPEALVPAHRSAVLVAGR
jgi:hypothetical protein